MRLLTTLILLLAFSHSASSQSYEGSVKYDKSRQDAIVIEYSYPAQAVENAFIQRMQKLGYKPREEKGILNRDRGFLVFKNAAIPEISDKRYDYIIYVERKSRKESDESVMYVIIQENDENVLKKMAVADVGNAKKYVNNMLPDIEVANLELQIQAQEEVVSRAEKKLRDLEDEHNALIKKMADNQKAREETRTDIDEQRKNLDLLRDRRKTMN